MNTAVFNLTAFSCQASCLSFQRAGSQSGGASSGQVSPNEEFSKFAPEGSQGIAVRHLKFIMSKTELLISRPSPSSPTQQIRHSVVQAGRVENPTILLPSLSHPGHCRLLANSAPGPAAACTPAVTTRV